LHRLRMDRMDWNTPSNCIRSSAVRRALVLVQPEMESCRFLLDTFRPWGGDFQGMGVYRSDEVWRKVWGGVWSVARAPRPHRRDEPTGLSLGTVASQQSRLPFHPAGSV